MSAAVYHVHHRHRKFFCIDAADIPVQRHGKRFRRRLRAGQRDAENRVCPKAPFVIRAVELHHPPVEKRLLEHVHPQKRLPYFCVDMVHNLLYPESEIFAVAVSELNRLKSSGTRPRRHGFPRADFFSRRLGFRGDGNLHRGISSRIQNFSRANICNCNKKRHSFPLSESSVF